MSLACPHCKGREDGAAIREHNLRCAEYGERVYLGRDDPRERVPYSIRRHASRALRQAPQDGARDIDSGTDRGTS